MSRKKPMQSNRPGSGGKPGGSQRPGGGSRPGGSQRPGGGSRPGGSQRPGGGGKPVRSQRPGGGGRPGGSQRPVGGGKPGQPQRPGGGGRPGQPQRPVGGVRPGQPQRPVNVGRPTIRLKQAHRLLGQGNYKMATHLFEGLAQNAVAQNLPQAPFLFVQTGRAYLYDGQNSKGRVFIKRGLRMLANAGRWGVLYQMGNRLLTELQEYGYTDESYELEEWLAETLPADSDEIAEAESILQAEHPILPTNCPNCGAPINSQEVIWIDEYTAECLYCGSPIRAES